ncbi:MAG: DNA polymerase III subunit beta [Fusobacteriales bacterium]|jgi:DNA polymerase-3 subunit beta|nr:DNA polymerase III subunit beta [Fusobacteriales bacterium]
MLNITVNRKDFLKGIQIVENAVSENKIRPVISGIFIEARENEIFLKGTDLELSINFKINGEVKENGKIVIKYKLIEEFLKQIEDEFIELIEESGKIIIKTGKINSEFSTYDPENYPATPILELGVEYNFDKQKLLESIEKARIAASLTPENLAVNCIRFEIEENKLKLVSSDTYRLIYLEEELDEEEKNKESLSVSIPLKTMDGLLKIMKLTSEDKIVLKSDGTKVYFRMGDVEILTRVIELQFPDYKAILTGAQYDKKILLNTKDFISVLKRTLIFVRDNYEAKNSGIFSFENDKLFLNGISENAKIKEEIPIIKEGEDIKISLNVKFLLDYISTITGEVTQLKMLNSKSSVLITEEKNDKSLYLTMPLALRD